MADNAKTIITARDMDKMSPQQRADAVDAATARSGDEVPEAFRSEVLAATQELGQQRRLRAERQVRFTEQFFDRIDTLLPSDLVESFRVTWVP